jgi:uncharacterized protein DUF2480
MKSENELINRVATSALVTFDLEQYYQSGERISIDIKDQLFQELILREKDFRDYIKNHDWSQYKNKFVAIYCSTDAIVPTWAYMLLSIALEGYASRVIFGSLEELETQLFYDTFSKIEWTIYKDAKVVIKGCSKVNVPVAVYVEATNRLKPLVSSIMYGEPCSTVPLFKKAKA